MINVKKKNFFIQVGGLKFHKKVHAAGSILLSKNCPKTFMGSHLFERIFNDRIDVVKEKDNLKVRLTI